MEEEGGGGGGGGRGTKYLKVRLQNLAILTF